MPAFSSDLNVGSSSYCPLLENHYSESLPKFMSTTPTTDNGNACNDACSDASTNTCNGTVNDACVNACNDACTGACNDACNDSDGRACADSKCNDDFCGQSASESPTSLCKTEVRNDLNLCPKLFTFNRDNSTDSIQQFTPNRDNSTDLIERFTPNRDDSTDLIERFTPNRDDSTDLIERFIPNRDNSTDLIERFIPNRDNSTDLIERFTPNRENSTDSLQQLTFKRDNSTDSLQPFATNNDNSTPPPSGRFLLCQDDLDQTPETTTITNSTTPQSPKRRLLNIFFPFRNFRQPHANGNGNTGDSCGDSGRSVDETPASLTESSTVCSTTKPSGLRRFFFPRRWRKSEKTENSTSSTSATAADTANGLEEKQQSSTSTPRRTLATADSQQASDLTPVKTDAPKNKKATAAAAVGKGKDASPNNSNGPGKPKSKIRSLLKRQDPAPVAPEGLVTQVQRTPQGASPAARAPWLFTSLISSGNREAKVIRPILPFPTISGNSGPFLGPQREEHLGRLTLVLDLDETLIHSFDSYEENYSFTVTAEFEGKILLFYVLKRPGVDEFLQAVGRIYEVVLFTASLSSYADPLVDQLDPSGVCSARLFRESCVNINGLHVKDLSKLGRDMKKVIIVDNSPIAYAFQPQNAVPIESWFDDPADDELTQLIPMLTELAEAEDAPRAIQNSLRVEGSPNWRN